MPTVTVAGLKLSYYVHRDGSEEGSRPLVLVHGAGGNLMSWPPALRRLPGHTVYTLDLPAHGRSQGEVQRELAGYVPVLLGFADALNLPAFVLGGHSMGGGIAIEAALSRPDRLAGLILAGTGARLPVSPQLLDLIREDFLAAAELIARWSYPADTSPRLMQLYVEQLRKTGQEVVYQDFAACAAWDRTRDIGQIAVPTLVVHGEADRMLPLRAGEHLAAHIRGARLVVVPGAGHMPMPEPGSAAQVGGIIGEFLLDAEHSTF